ncbi:Metallo-dependent phosphatase-like protein [Scheffersomyces xylosifermentans]|uniref:Metallo-dependent phosphatase-like protein n=1 Tax=Scheffersomyces xylosifermentans TaxID=1304137 RepID=UPI00315CC27C
MLTLAIGDLYIPERAIDLPFKFRKLLCPEPNAIPTNSKIANVICLGNINNSAETLKFLYTLSPSLHLVKGEFDDSQILSQQLFSLSNKEQPIPYYNVITHDNLRIGFTNGFQIVPKNDPLSLSTLARELDVDVLIWGGTHKVEAYTLDGKFFINPGSATGAYSFDWPEYFEEEDEEEQAEDGEVTNEKDDAQEEVKEETRNEVVEEVSKEATKPEESSDLEKNENVEEAPSAKQSLFGEEDDDEKSEISHSKEEGNPLSSDINANSIDEAVLNEVTELNSIIPSFCLLDTHGSTCTLYIYTYLNGEVKVDKVTFTKE